ncbi:MAG TPA: hypothetical protein VKD21_01285 [Acidimicrobiales bacterium]|nr:hypothetical protein [Acidimicrobiales bacterium]
MIAHVAGMPIEEALLPLVSGAGGLLLARAWIASRVRRPQEGRQRRPQNPGH